MSAKQYIFQYSFCIHVAFEYNIINSTNIVYVAISDDTVQIVGYLHSNRWPSAML